jgi:hypothetical protein
LASYPDIKVGVTEEENGNDSEDGRFEPEEE